MQAIITMGGTAEEIAALALAVQKRQDFSIGEKPEVITRSTSELRKVILEVLDSKGPDQIRLV